jgi:acetolactate synthase-1/2/3 large subunit
MIQIDIEHPEIGRNRAIDVGIFGDAKAVLEEMLDLAEEQKKWQAGNWLQILQEARQAFDNDLEAFASAEGAPIHPSRVIKEVRDVCDVDTTLICDGGDVQMWCRAVWSVRQAGLWQEAGTLALIGNGIPFALAAKLARPDSKVVLVTGDGSFGFLAMEFDTAVRHDIPIVAVVLNDQGWGLIKSSQRKQFGEGKSVACDLGLIRYDKLVETLGGFGQFVEDPRDIKAALLRAIDSGRPSCINVLTGTSPYLDFAGADYASSLEGF